jgi:hypothetical protein
MKQYWFFLSLILVVAASGCGSDPADNSDLLASDNSDSLTAESVGSVRPQTPNADSQLERLMLDDAAYQTQSFGSAKSSKNWAGIILGALFGLAELGGLDIIPDWYVWSYQPQITLPDFSELTGEPTDITGVWSGSLTVMRDECGPESFGQEREFRISIQENDGNIVVLDQDGLVYVAEPADPLQFEAWWSDSTGSISSLIFDFPVNNQAHVTVRDEINRDGAICVQEYWGWLGR